jgi:hypothetical protein
MSDHDREVLRFFLRAIEDAESDEAITATAFYRIGKLTYRARDVLLQRLKDDNPTHASGDCPTVRR